MLEHQMMSEDLMMVRMEVEVVGVRLQELH